MKVLIYACWACLLGAFAHDVRAADENQSLQAQEEEEVVVVASRLPTQRQAVGRSLTVFDAAQIRSLGHEYAADLFRYMPGVAVNRGGGYAGLTQLRIRGAEANHSVVMIDGIDVSAAGSGEFDFSSLLSAGIERVEVLRGAQSGLYGSNALGGVISIVTRRPREGVQIDTQLEGGEHDTRHLGVSLAGGSSRLRGALTYARRESQFDLSEDDSLIGAEGDLDDNRSITGSLELNAGDRLTLRAFGRYMDRRTDTDGFDFSGGALQGRAIDDHSYSNSRDWTAGVTGQLSIGPSGLGRMSVSRTDTELDGGVFGSESGRDQVNLDLGWDWSGQDRLGAHSTGFVQYEQETFVNLFPFDPSQAPEQRRDMLAWGIEQRLSLDDRLFINGSIRLEHNEDFEDTTTYALDAAYELVPSATRLNASFAVGVTNPTFFEQFGFVPGSFVGNPALKPEHSTGWEVGVQQSLLSGALQLGVSWFRADLEDEIRSSFPSVINIRGRSERQGAEFSMRWSPGHRSSLAVTYTHTNADEPDAGEVRRPAHMASLSAAHSLLDGRLQLSASAAYNGEFLDEDFRNYFVNGFVAERTELDDFVLVNLRAAYQLLEALEVYVRVENLFDEQYVEQISYATPGRTVFAGLRYSFGF